MYVVPLTRPIPELGALPGDRLIVCPTGEARIVATVTDEAWPVVLEAISPSDRAVIAKGLRGRLGGQSRRRRWARKHLTLLK